ncbi:MAG: hypothetical protein COA79_14685 [Planctomycetota bacterium]|nr:MAG: hypothetical protein COA79_14685 [Planctomycetota bacterium]
MLIQSTNDYLTNLKNLAYKKKEKRNFLKEAEVKSEINIYDNINEATKYFSSIRNDPINKTEEAFKLLNSIKKSLDENSNKSSVSIIDIIEFDQYRISSLIID